MKCEDIQQLLVPFLDGELEEQERLAVEAHLNACDACRADYIALAGLQQNVIAALHARAERETVSPEAWQTLETRLGKTAVAPHAHRSGERPPLLERMGSFFTIFAGGSTMVKLKNVLAWSILAIIVAALCTVALVPSVRAQVGEMLQWFVFESPTGGEEVAIAGSAGFTPLRPSYVPAGFEEMAVGFNPEAAGLSYWNGETGHVLIIDEVLLTSPSAKGLPHGKAVDVGGKPGVLVSGIERTISFVELPPTPQAPVDEGSHAPIAPAAVESEDISVAEGTQLVFWYSDSVRVEIFSDLPEEEIVKVAVSLEPAEEIEDAPESVSD